MLSRLIKFKPSTKLATQGTRLFSTYSHPKISAGETLIAEYMAGHGFDKNSPWYIKGPKFPNELPSDVLHLYLLITKLNLWNDVLKEPGPGGFWRSCPPAIEKASMHPAITEAGHSGGSFSSAMRDVQRLGWAVENGQQIDNHIASKCCIASYYLKK